MQMEEMDLEMSVLSSKVVLNQGTWDALGKKK